MNWQQWLSAALTALSFCACAELYAPGSRKAGDQTFISPIWTTDDLYMVDVAGPGVLFMADPTTDLNRYKGLWIDDIEIWPRKGKSELRSKDEDEIREYARRTLERILEDDDLKFVDEPGADILRMRVSISDVEFHRTYVEGGSSKTLNPSGGITAILELRDFVDDRRLMLFSERRPLPFGVYFGPGYIELERVQDALDRFSRDVLTHLTAARMGELPTPRGPRPQ